MKFSKPLIKYSVIVAVVIIIVVACYYYGRKSAKVDNLTNLPNETDWGAALSDAESEEVRVCALELYNDLKGAHFLSSRDDTPYDKMNVMSDRLLVAVANQFKSAYCAEDESIITWLEGDVFSGKMLEKVDNLVKRLINLGIL